MLLADELKRLIATESHALHPKYCDALTLFPWWRVSLSINNNVDRLKALPALTSDFGDKILLLLCESHPMPMPTGTPEERRAFRDVITAELPAFVAFLRSWEIPAELRKTKHASRFGHDHFHHPRLTAALFEQEPQSSLADGRRVKESAKLTNRTSAQRLANALESEARAGLSERDARALAARLHERCGLSEHHARKMASALYARLGGRCLAAASVADYCAQWLARKRAEVSPATAQKYSEVTRHFLAFLGDGARRDMATIPSREVAAFRDDMAARLSVGSVNVALKIVRIVFGDAVKAKLVSGNEAASVPILKASNERAARRPFTDAKLRRLLAVAPPEWRAMILTGFYAGGQRLGDVARFTWQNVDLANGELRFVTRKTSRPQVIPIAAQLLACLTALPSSDDPKAPVFPHARALLNASKNEHVGALSNEFHELLVEAGLAVPHVHHRTGEGRSARRKMGALGFHSLRHTFTSWAKSVGIGSAIVQDMVGHDSAAISAHYTTIDDATKRTALDSLPDLTAPAKARKTAPKTARKSARE